jgi:hypothetical protein
MQRWTIMGNNQNSLPSRAEKEKQRMVQILQTAGISGSRMDALAPIIDNAAWMKAKLDDARAEIKDSSVAIPYDNGGGQTGIRENPQFKAYEALWKSYISGMSYILQTLPPETAKEADTEPKPATVLEMVKSRHTS